MRTFKPSVPQNISPIKNGCVLEPPEYDAVGKKLVTIHLKHSYACLYWHCIVLCVSLFSIVSLFYHISSERACQSWYCSMQQFRNSSPSCHYSMLQGKWDKTCLTSCRNITIEFVNAHKSFHNSWSFMIHNTWFPPECNIYLQYTH